MIKENTIRKDFVLLNFTTHNIDFPYMATSSAEKSLEIAKILGLEGSHVDCERVENIKGINNVTHHE